MEQLKMAAYRSTMLIIITAKCVTEGETQQVDCVLYNFCLFAVCL